MADATTRFAEERGFTRRELEVFELVVDGVDLAGIAERLDISPGTVKAHLHRIYQKSGVTSRTALMREFGQFGRRA